jgi:hypothetical protein
MRRRMAFSLFFLAALSSTFRADVLSAQDVRVAPDLPESGVVLRDSPQPLRFFDVTGRKAGVFGRQDGQFEAWIYPIKLLHNFRIEFLQEGDLEPVRGETLLRDVVTRPDPLRWFTSIPVSRCARLFGLR